jgi:polar amino acid transport system substrate-binding protein
LLTGCSGNSNSSSANYRTLDQIKDSGKITIGVFSDKSPFGYVDENGNYQGYDIELANRLGQDLGVDVELVSTEAANRVEYLQTGKVDVILANFTVTPERAEAVDFADPYMNVALGVVSHKDKVVTDLDQIGDRTVIVISGTTAETYLTEHNKDLKLEKYDTYAAAKTAFENNPDAVWANDNTEVIAFANQAGPEYVVGIEQLGDTDTIAPAVSKGNESLLNWINEDLKNLGSENFFHADYEKTLLDTYGAAYEDTLVVEPGQN